MTGTAPSLAPLPDAFADTRDALHQVAFFVLAPRRYESTDRLGLRATPGGFGTTWFDGPDGRERVRVEGAVLVVEVATGGDERGGVDHRRDLRPTSVGEACAFVGIEHRPVWFDDFHDPLEPWDPDRTFALDDAAAAALAAWFSFGTAALEAVRETPGAVDPSPVQLWPEHFDPATEIGPQDAGRRASYGASPGDREHDQPYLYVAPWGEVGSSAFWNDGAFGGASLPYADLLTADDPLAVAIGFLRHGHALLAGDDG